MIHVEARASLQEHVDKKKYKPYLHLKAKVVYKSMLIKNKNFNLISKLGHAKSFKKKPNFILKLENARGKTQSKKRLQLHVKATAFYRNTLIKDKEPCFISKLGHLIEAC